MKKLYKPLLIVLLTFASATMFAQVPPPPPPDHGATGNQNGGNAPIGSGLLILLGLGAIYGSRKLYNLNEKNLEE